MKKFDLIKEKIDKITKNAPHKIEFSHSQSVLKWVLKLKPYADISLKIAALGHDIDRSFPEQRIKPTDFSDYNEYKKRHSEKSAEIISNLMKKIGFENKIIEKTKFLIEKHEVGGKGDAEILKEADSISFFENNLLDYIDRNPEYVKDKIKFMYNRLSKEARRMVLQIKFQTEEIENLVRETISHI